MKKFGWYGKNQRIQRYRCTQCGKTFSDTPPRPFDELRIPIALGCQAVHLLVEGMGIRATERLTRLHRDTVMAILEVAGHKCARLLDEKILNVAVESVQVDELWCFVGCKQIHNTLKAAHLGDQYTFLGIDRASKLILSHTVGKRDYPTTLRFVQDIKKRVDGRIQLTSDQWQGYVRAVLETFYSEIDFAQQQKEFAPSPNGSSNVTARRYSPPQCVGIKTKIHIGNPNWNQISTSHVERTNLSVRLFTRRFTRLTLGYSKTLENLKHAVALFVAHFNFCRVHSAHKQTPAMAAGLTDRVWTISDLLAPSIAP